MVKAKRFILRKHFDGMPKPGDVELVEEELRELKENEFLAKALYISVDSYTSTCNKQCKLGATVIGQQIAIIIESRAEEYPIGKYVVASFGWRNYTIGTHKPPHYLGFPAPRLLPDLAELPISLGIGMLGTTGNTAYFGFLEICQPKEGQTIVVSAAAGAVGSHVGQIAKIKGCYVVGITGSDEKGRWLIEELGFDEYVNYKKPRWEETLEKCTPNGIDCYFDNVGGQISSVVLNLMNFFGKVSICGYISLQNSKNEDLSLVSPVQPIVVNKELRMEGFIVHRWLDRWNEGIQQNKQWILEGKLKYKETITEGFENTFEAFINMLQGGNVGKAIVKL